MLATDIIEPAAGPIPTDEQERCLAAIDRFMADRRRQTFHVQGLAGSGRTTLLAHAAHQYRPVGLVALAGKAASVLRCTTGLDATTIHRAFYRLVEDDFDWRGRKILRSEPVHEPGPLRGSLVLADECSMVGEDLARDLLRTGAKVIATGDPGQLPPVSGEQFFRRPDFTLRQIHRQALEGSIIRQALRVRNGEPYRADGPDFRVQSKSSCSEDAASLDRTDDDALTAVRAAGEWIAAHASSGGRT